ncbi:MAG TPA: hypothetical protein VGY66_35845 [Gemmataceae bacterium]|jgi:hypothetical protein|nr:hypothetical protein [Gemmataceae bacterium]
MDESIIEQEFPYKDNRILKAWFTLSVVMLVLAAGSLWWALTERRDILLNGIILLRGLAASIVRWSLFGIAAVTSGISLGFLFWTKLTSPCQRIAFSSSGIHLPRNEWARKEEFVAFRNIAEVILETVRGRYLHFTCPQGRFSICRAMLSKTDFEEISAWLQQKTAEARPRSNVIVSRRLDHTQLSDDVNTAPRGLSRPGKDLLLRDSLSEQELIDQLGSPVATFKPGRGNLIAGLILGILLVGPGSLGAVWICLFAPKGNMVGAILLIVFALGGAGLLVWVRRALSLRVLICPSGFVEIYGNKAAGCCWDQISEVTLQRQGPAGEFVGIYPGKAAGCFSDPIGAVTAQQQGHEPNPHRCTVRREDGREFIFTTNRVKDLGKLINVFASAMPNAERTRFTMVFGKRVHVP